MPSTISAKRTNRAPLQHGVARVGAPLSPSSPTSPKYHLRYRGEYAKMTA